MVYLYKCTIFGNADTAQVVYFVCYVPVFARIIGVVVLIIS